MYILDLYLENARSMSIMRYRNISMCICVYIHAYIKSGFKEAQKDNKCTCLKSILLIRRGIDSGGHED